MAEKKTEDLPSGYSNLSDNSESVPGPSAPKFHEEPRFEGDFPRPSANLSAPPPDPIPGPGPLVYNPPNLVFEDIYEACVKYAGKHCCYGKRFLNEMKLLDIMTKAVFYYKLESFGEKRESNTKYSPYLGEPTDGRENGQPPRPWDVTALPPDLFKDCDVTATIPHSDVIETCSKCHGNGDVRCGDCGGSGNESCYSCSGTGRELIFMRCKNCDGSGTKMCWSCIGIGKITCKKCNGNKRIKSWRILKVTWTNHVGEYFTDMGYLPNDLIREAKGVELLKEKDLSLEPITCAPDATVNAASASILESHKNSFLDEMIIRQRHTLRAFPLTRVTYQWGQTDGEFYVYDIGRKVYFEDYPQKYCCCTCS